MYTPPLFRENRPEILQEAMKTYPLATLVTMGSNGLQCSQIPMLLESPGSEGLGILRGHVARANPQWSDFDANVEALALFHGPQHYISPSWYPSKKEHGKVVPTWNYVAVEVRGRMTAVEDAAWLHDFVRRLTVSQEAGTANPWRVEDAPEDYIEKLLPQIVGIELAISSIEGKWKMNQNRPLADRAGAAGELRRIGSDEARKVAELIGKNLSGS